MADCIFCKIVSGEIPSTKVFENDDVIAFNDLDPKAPVHILVIPKCHISDMTQISAENSEVISKIYEAIAVIGKRSELDSGFRVVCNSGVDAGQSVPHLHFHLLGGRSLSWPPG